MVMRLYLCTKSLASFDWRDSSSSLMSAVVGLFLEGFAHVMHWGEGVGDVREAYCDHLGTNGFVSFDVFVYFGLFLC